jgi:hypothetical protein
MVQRLYFFLFLITILILFPVLPAWAEPNPDSIPFAPPVAYDVGDYPSSVFAADLDNDGYMDLAVANAGSNTVSILKNNGAGTFQPKVDYAVNSSPHSVFCGDLDNDGYMDLVVANNFSNNISILKNNGDGTFQPKVDYPTGDYPISVFSADLDGDSDLDLAVANNWYVGTVSILKNNGDGTFQSKVDYSTPGYPNSVFCADLDGDSDLDLSITCEAGNYAEYGTLFILKSNGDGTFSANIEYLAGIYPISVFATDLDHDSDKDLAVANAASYTVLVFKNDGDGTFEDLPVNGYFAGGIPHSIVCADLDGDGSVDLAVANHFYDSDGNVFILKNNGSGVFPIRADYLAGSQLMSLACADLDNDTDLDLVLTSGGDDKVYILRNLTREWLCGDTNLDKVVDIADVVYTINYVFYNGPYPICSTDVNGDGIIDIGDIVYLINYVFYGGVEPSC